MGGVSQLWVSLWALAMGDSHSDLARFFGSASCSAHPVFSKGIIALYIIIRKIRALAGVLRAQSTGVTGMKAEKAGRERGGMGRSVG